MHAREIIVENADHVVEEEDRDKGIDSGIVSIGYVRLKDLSVNDEDNPFGTEFKIKVVKRFQPPQTDDEDQITFLGPVYDEMDQLALPKFDQRIHENLQSTVPELIHKSLNKVLYALNTLEIQRFASLHEELLTTIRDKVGKSVRKTLWKEMDIVKDRLSSVGEQQLNDDELASVQEKQPYVQEKTKFEQTPQITKQVPPESTALVVHSSEEKDLGEKVSEEKPPSKRLKLADLKAEKEKSEKKLKKVMTPAEIQAQAQKLAEYETKRAKMLAEYNHYITYRADKLPITKISYKIHKVSKDATMRIKRNNQPLSKANDILLKNLKAKFEWIKSQAGKLGIPPPPELTTFGLFAAKKKRKINSEIIKEVFVKEYIVVDGMHRNLVPPPGVEGSKRESHQGTRIRDFLL
nr:hypothetical protein [Tanacetum cinerariifolium]